MKINFSDVIFDVVFCDTKANKGKKKTAKKQGRKKKNKRKKKKTKNKNDVKKTKEKERETLRNEQHNPSSGENTVCVKKTKNTKY